MAGGYIRDRDTGKRRYYSEIKREGRAVKGRNGFSEDSFDSTNVDVESACFIATASGADSGELGILRSYRDTVLMKNPLGTAFISAYYKVSPPLASCIRNNPRLKRRVKRSLVDPLVDYATRKLAGVREKG